MNTPAPRMPVAQLHEAAERHAAQRQFGQAIALYEHALHEGHGDPTILVQLSYLHSLAGHYREALAYARRAHASGSTSPRLLAELVPRLRTFNEIPAIQETIQRLGPEENIPIPLLITLASHLTYANLPEQAIAFLDEARRADPDYPPTLLARCQVSIYLGRFEEARADVEHSLRRAPEIAQSYWLQAALRRQTPDAHHVDAIRRELARPGRKPNDVALLEFALHKELDDLGDHDAAWDALMRGCHAKRATLDYAHSQSVALFSALKQLPASQPPSAAAAATAAPIFIVGMHRSGTTLLEQMLDGSPDVHGIGELYDFTSAMRHATDHHCRGVTDTTVVARAGSIDFADVGRRYLASTAWRIPQGERFFTDKLPSNFLNAGFIARALPQARILHMVRDPRETCFSNLRELFSEANPYSYDLGELGRFHAEYRSLMAHWHARFPGRILDVDYARLVSEPEEVLKTVCRFCGLDFQPAMLDIPSRKRGVVTASAVQVRSRPQTAPTPKWKPYERHLAPLLQMLEGRR